MTELGRGTPISESRVDAGNWMTALGLARKEIGESGTVPPGASCSVSPDGTVTVHDAMARKTYVLAPDVGDDVPATSLVERVPRGSSTPAESVPRRPDADAPIDPRRTMAYDTGSGAQPATKKGFSTKTVAFEAADLQIRPPEVVSDAESPAKADAKKEKGLSTRTVAYNAKDLGLASPDSAPLKSEPKKEKGLSTRTVAYNAKDLGLAPPDSAPAKSEPKKEKGLSTRTVAYNAKDLGLAPPDSAPTNTEPKRGKGLSTRTVAYNAKDLGLAPPDSPAKSEPKKEKGLSTRTVAYNARDLGLAPRIDVAKPDEAANVIPTTTIAYEGQSLGEPASGMIPPPGVPSQPPRPRSASEPDELEGAEGTGAAVVDQAGAAESHADDHSAEDMGRPTMPDGILAPKGGATVMLQHSRDEEPSKDSPLCYRERTYVVARDTSHAVVEEILMARFDELRMEIEDRPRGKLVNMAIFDHEWTERPDRPPLLTLQWKDWRGEPVVKWGSLSQPPPASAPPPDPAPSDELHLDFAEPAIATHADPAREVSTADRLVTAFEALQDLFFLTTPMEGLEFATRLLGDLIPVDAISACLYDINSDELRFVSLTGPGAEEQRGRGVPRLTGMLGVATTDPSTVHLVEKASTDPRVDPAADGRPSLATQSLAVSAVTYQGRLMGTVQLINRKQREGFSSEDANLLAYVSEKLGEFLQSARMRSDKPPYGA